MFPLPTPSPLHFPSTLTSPEGSRAEYIADVLVLYERLKLVGCSIGILFISGGVSLWFLMKETLSG